LFPLVEELPLVVRATTACIPTTHPRLERAEVHRGVEELRARLC
jgi:hypothetical protein